VRYRRALLLLRYLNYANGLPPHHLAHSALLDSLNLARAGRSCWVTDMLWSWRMLPVPVAVSVDELCTLLCADNGAETLQEKLQTALKTHAQTCTTTNIRLPLLRDRQERDRSGRLANEAYALRQYLRYVSKPDHRLSLTRLLLGDHALAIEALRRSERGRSAVAQSRRLCRFCRTAVETEMHALFECTSSAALAALRGDFLALVEDIAPGSTRWHAFQPLALFHEVLQRKRTLPILAGFVHRVLEVYATAELYIAE
jgi:hypothetical protein